MCAKTDPGSFKDIRRAGFECIQQMFLAVNEHEEKVHIISLPSAPVNGVATKLEFLVLVLPHEMRGIEVIWGIMQDCDKKNADLTEKVTDLITKLYHSVVDSVTQEEQSRFQDEFCSEWLRQLKAATCNPNTSEEDKKAFVKTAASMMKSFLSETERNGTGALRSHSALEKGQLIEKLILQNQISQQTGIPRILEINTHSNMTVWELKELAAAKFKISPRRLELRRADQAKPALSDLANGKLLRDMKVESFEILQVQKKPHAYVPRKPLLTARRDLSPEAKGIFTSWF